MSNCLPHTLAYHSFSDDDVESIRTHLLDWYAVNRRRLPWRGDPPPYGSAAKPQPPPPLSRYFTPTTNTTPTTTATAPTPSSAPSLATANKRARHARLAPPAPEPQPQPESEVAQPVAVSAYGVWVSEVMLQQTRVDTVVAYYTRWMARFPTLTSLAAATPDEVNTAWSGLGYYRRARMLHAAARHVVGELGGVVPCTVEALLGVPGVGPYTAGAVASIAYGAGVPLVDGNVSRVLSRLRALHASPRAGRAVALHWQLAGRLVHNKPSAGELNQALMELGATVCLPRVADCGRCPVRRWCRAAEEVAQRRRPVGGEAWQVERGRVEVEVEEVEDESEQRNDSEKRDSSTGKANEEQMAEADEQHTAADPFTPSTRDGSAKGRGKRSSVPKHLELDATPCTLCESLTAAPTTVLQFPTKAIKTPPTDEHVTVCVVRRQRPHTGAEWLLVRRPAEGLLAGQWEFPAVVHAPSPPQPPRTSARAPSAAERRRRLVEGMAAMLPAELAARVGEAACEAVGELVHVFSHRRHLMHVQRCELVGEESGEAGVEGKGADGRRWRWMTESEMAETGLTTGQRKVLALSRGAKVKTAKGNGSGIARGKRKVDVQDVEERADESADEAGEQSDGADCGDARADESRDEWEVWPVTAAPDFAVEEADGVIVID